MSTFSVPVYDKSDPKAGDAAPVVPFYLPRYWKETKSDGFGSAAMAISGGSMMMKNVVGAWAGLIAALLSLFNQAPLRQKDGSGTGPLGSIAMSAVVLFGVYIPSMLLQPDPVGGQAGATGATGGSVPLPGA